MDGFKPLQLKNAPWGISPGHKALLADGDLLVSRANTRQLVGLAGVYRDIGVPCLFPDLMMRIRVKKSYSTSFLELVLRHHDTRRRIMAMAQGTSESMVKLSKREFETLRIPDIPLARQLSILEVIQAVDDQVQGIEAAVVKLESFEEGLLQDTFGSKDPAGVVSELGTVVTGATPPPDWDSSTLEGGIPLFTPSQVRDAEGALSDPERSIASSRARDLRIIPAGSTLAVCIGFGAGKVALSGVESCTNQQINAVIPHQGFDHRFVYLAVRSAMRRAKSLLNLQVTPIINKSDFSQLPVCVPSEGDRKQLVEQIWAVRMKRASLIAEKAKLGNLKAALSSDLLTVA
ncbi:restriction endonuclease subunit S [Streptomyces spinoverrucosus]|uniref:restriction endonuclease subunit S n=1 Tax=Streptomyces spinoverrucosus TaxID=284043 RepID=UPI0018C3D36B|nr:restriction endonuclease subunit S [Streptomyces spinoverrucosus]MBG0853074.1 restriction endonuclease subunit S [Streptomyces spinoverrucosus]